jgi:hypothetical protein
MVRDEARIPRILDYMKRLWKEHPDWRYGQLMINCGLIPDTMQGWLYEDDDLEKALKKKFDKAH